MHLFCVPTMDPVVFGGEAFVVDEDRTDDRPIGLLQAPTMPEVTSLLAWLEMLPTGTQPRLRQALVERIAVMLGVDFVFVGHLVRADPPMIRMATWLQEGVIQENIKYLLAGTPCERVIATGEFCAPRGVAEQFPEDTFLTEHSIAAYAGVPLTRSSGQRIGVFGVMSRRPLADATAVCQLLHFCADRLSLLRRPKRHSRGGAAVPPPQFAPRSHPISWLESAPAAFVAVAVAPAEITLVDVVDAGGILPLLAARAEEPSQRMLELLSEYRRARTAQEPNLFSGTEFELNLPAADGTWIQSRWKRATAARAGAVAVWSGVLLPASRQADMDDAGLTGETLIRETHHRIKNNLQIVASLLRMQAVASSDAAVRVALGDAMLRVSAIAAIHVQLQSNSLITRVDLRRFLTSLI